MTRDLGSATRRSVIATLACVAASAISCGEELSLDHRPCPCASGYVCCELTKLCVESAPDCAFEISPSDARVRLGGALQLDSNVPVTWSVDSPDGGSIGPSGLYRAPLRPGKYEVRAKTIGGASAVKTVRVGPTALRHLAGIRGGKGTADGIGTDARFVDPTSIVGDDQFLYVSDGDRWGTVPGFEGCMQTCSPDSVVCAEACCFAQAEQGLFGVRRINRATREVSWLVKNRRLGSLAVDGFTLVGATRGPIPFVLYGSLVCGLDEWRLLTRVDVRNGKVEPLAGKQDLEPPRDGVGDQARFSSIRGMVARAGKVYVADASALREVEIATGKVTTLAAGPSWPGETEASAGFLSLNALALDDESLYAVDAKFTQEYPPTSSYQQTVWRYDIPSGKITELRAAAQSGDGSAHTIQSLCFDTGNTQTPYRAHAIIGGCLIPGVLASGASAECYSDIPIDWRGELWCAGSQKFFVTDPGAGVVREAGAPAHEPFAGPPDSDDCTSQPGAFMCVGSPETITADEAGNIVFRHFRHSNKTEWLSPTLEFVRLDGTWEFGMALGPGPLLYGFPNDTSLGFPPSQVGVRVLDLAKNSGSTLWTNLASRPELLAYDGAGALIGLSNGELLKLNLSSGVAATLASGYQGVLAVDGTKRIFTAEAEAEPGSPATRLVEIDLETRVARSLAEPADGWHATALAFDPAGVLYVVESDSARIRGLVVASGEIFDLVGVLGSRGLKLGSLPAGLNRPSGLAILPDGSLAITDAAENAVVVAQ